MPVQDAVAAGDAGGRLRAGAGAVAGAGVAAGAVGARTGRRARACPPAIGAQLPRPLTLQAWQVPQGPRAAADAVGAEAADALAGRRAGLAVRLERAALGRARALAGVGRDAVAVGGAGGLAGVACRRRRAEQLDEVGAAQAPVPLQCEIGVKVEPLQVAVPQETPVPPSWQCPAPSQAPVLPQGGLVAQRPCGSWLLAGDVRAVARAARDVAGLAGRARAGAAADAVDAAVAGQAVGASACRLAEALLVAAEVGLRIADVGRQAVGVAGAGRLAGRGAVADVGRAG